MARYTSDENLGKKHGKYDMDRVGLFSEMPYMIGNKYKQPDSMNNIRDTKKSQMYPGILKTKTGLQDAYFDRNFKRLFENEKWRPTPGLFNKNVHRGESKENAAPFVPTGDTKRHSTPGDYFGTFGPKLPALSAAKKPLPKKQPRKQLPNIVTAPTNTRGPGYTDIGLSPFPEYKPSPYNSVVKISPNGKNKTAPFLTAGFGEFFEKNPYFNADIKPTYRTTFKEKFKGTPFLPPSTTKNFGDGFDKWPEHSIDRYVDPRKIGIDHKKGVNNDQSKIFYPQSRNKSMYTTSTIQRKLKNAMSNLNWRTFDIVSFPADKNKKS